MIARQRDDGKAEFLMDLNELMVFESMLMYFSMMIPNKFTRHVADKMRFDANGGIMSLGIIARNPEAAKKAQAERNKIVAELLAAEKKANERDAEDKARLDRMAKEDEKAKHNPIFGEKLNAALNNKVRG